MLNIIKLKSNKKDKLNNNLINKKTNTSKDFLPSVREWKNSIYVFNKNTLSLIPESSKLVIKLIKGYFNLYHSKIEDKIRKTKLRSRFRKISANKIFVSDGEFKHTNNKVLITLYVYNRQKYNYIYKLRKRYLRLIKKSVFQSKLLLIRSKGLEIIKKENNKKNMLIEALKTNNNLYFKNYESLYYKEFIKKSLRRVKLYVYYKQLLYVNKSKFNYTYLKGLISLLKKIYNKNVEFNIVNLKYFYFNSDIVTESLTLKLRKNRKKLLRYLNTFVRKVKIQDRKWHELFGYNLTNTNNTLLDNVLDPVNDLLHRLFLSNDEKSKTLKKTMLDQIKYKNVTGVRVEAAGRLTKRYTASRSLFKVRYKGNLENTDSSYKGLSSIMLRNNLRSNLQYTKLNSKTRIGSFGIKGWVSGN